ncbi:Thermitase (modular protein) [Desulfosarcina cetonica]|uniref:S8 family serine peptidase n=1 Tax=Desulfosarcina cetonica TaxID=90730 RepID=UPI0006D2A374|nr:S8 family serine peptidase [Desulfosarcina cetonica]VTR67966.1 Thermitase (modular protein) [Desulfosarcina cetonica]
MKYKDKLSGKEFTFTPKTGQVMVKFSADADMLSATRSLEKNRIMTPLYDSTPSRGYGCYQLLEDGADVQSVAKQPGIGSLMPVVVDNEGNERFFLPGEITVQFKPGVSPEAQEKVIAGHHCTILRKQQTPGYYTLQLPSGMDIFDAIETFNKNDDVLFAEPSNVGYNDALYMPDDPSFNNQWYLHNTGQTGGTSDADVDAPAAWDIERGDAGIVIAVLDTGVDLDHPDLQGNILSRPTGEDWDFADPDLVPEPGTESWEDHGTHCAGIAAGVDNGTGILGLAPGCSILPIRIDLHGGAYQNRADAINFVTSIAPRYGHVVMSCSWRTSGNVTAIQNAIIAANTQGILVCFAAGNDYTDTDVTPKYPGVMPEVLSVAATDHKDVKAGFSNYGSSVDVSAPGVNIYSTVPNDTYGSKDGTSMACPLVAGLAGLIWSRNPTLTHLEVRTIIENNCDNINALNPGYNGKLGKGRINAYRALNATPALCRFKVKGKIKFPQKNAGSSSALTFYTTAVRFPWFRPVRQLLFLTQKPYSERIYFLNPTTGAVIRSIDPRNNDTIGGMTWDGKAIRVANVTTGAGSINAINPSTGAQVGSISAPSGRGEGLTYDGKHLYYSTISRIHKINPATGAVLRSFPVPGGGRCRALTHNGGNLIFAGDPFANEIIVFDKTSLRVSCRFKAPGRGNYRVDGLAYDKITKTLYIANQSENLIYYGKLA